MAMCAVGLIAACNVGRGKDGTW